MDGVGGGLNLRDFSDIRPRVVLIGEMSMGGFNLSDFSERHSRLVLIDGVSLIEVI